MKNSRYTLRVGQDGEQLTLHSSSRSRGRTTPKYFEWFIQACEEATVSASFCYPKSPAFDKWLELWGALRKVNGTDLDLGLKLPQMFKNAAFTNIKSQLVQPVLSTLDEKRLLKLNVKETTNAAIDAGFATKEAMEKLADDLEILAEDENYFIGYVRNTQAWGQKIKI